MIIIKEIFTLIGTKRRTRMFLLLPAMILASLLEMAGLAMVVSICSVIVSDDVVDEKIPIQWLQRAFHISSEDGTIITVLVLLIVLYVFKLVYLAWENYAVAKFVRMTRNEMTTVLYGRIIRSPYSFFLRHTTAEIQNMLGQDMFQLSSALNACMQTIMETLVVIGMGIFLLMLNPIMTAFTAGSIVVLLVITRVFLNRPIRSASMRQREASRNRLKWLHYTAEGIKDIKTSRREAFFETHFAYADAEFAQSDYLKQFWTKLPSLCIEAVMVISVLLYLLFFVQSGETLTGSLPGLTALAWTAVRLLPACSRINTSLTQIGYAKPSVEAIRCAMEETAPANRGVEFASQTEVDISKGIVLRHVSFSYESRTDDVVKDVGLEIPAGCAVGIVGISGAGKTTLLNLLLGLLTPTDGTVEIDGIPLEKCRESYWKRLAYVPQTTFLLDDTIRNNVAMGIEQNGIDDAQVWAALEKAALADTVRALPHGLDTQIGERGVTLSGGERQRLGLARAMYPNPSVIVFDEATSALDSETEAEVLKSIGRLKGEKTLVIVSHRLSALSVCDHIYRVSDGSVYRVNGNKVCG